MDNYQKAQASGESFSLPGSDGTGKVVEAITADRTLTAADSGKEFLLTAAEGKVITLPALMNGWHAKFRTNLAFDTSDWTVVSAANVIEGYASVNYATIPAANENTISFAAAAETIGDWVEVVCDGTSFNVYGVGNTAASITFTAPA